MNCKKNAKSRSDDEHQLFDPAVEKVVEIGLERLRPFENHPFKVKEDEAMARLMESIERYGIMNPLIVMPTTEGFYRIISGHRRKYCAEKLGYTKVPVIIRYMKEDDSIISMVDSNLHREKILFSEKAFAYSMKTEAMKRKTGKRRKTQEGLLEALKGTKTIDLIGQEILIASERYPAALVKSKFLKLNYMHIDYVISCMKKNTTKVKNIKKYLLAALFNAPSTIDGYYQAEVNADMPHWAG